MGKTNSATDSDDEAGLITVIPFSIIHINIIHSYATTNNFNPGQASIMSYVPCCFVQEQRLRCFRLQS
jgi:hypothetical protein